MTVDIDTLVANAASIQREIDNVSGQLQEIREVVERIPVVQQLNELSSRLSRLRKEYEQLRESIRQQCVAVYKETGEKRPHPAAEIRMYTNIIYDEKDAVAFCMERLPEALRVDKRQFKAFVLNVTAPDFVQVEKEPRCFLATDLSLFI